MDDAKLTEKIQPQNTESQLVAWPRTMDFCQVMIS